MSNDCLTRAELHRLASKNRISQTQLDRHLIKAAKAGYTDIVEQLLARGADIHVSGDEALCEAARHGHTKSVEVLLARGAWDLDDKDLLGAVEGGHIETAELLIRNSYYGFDVIYHELVKQATKSGYKDAREFLVARGANIHIWEPILVQATNIAIFNNILEQAIKCGRVELARELQEGNFYNCNDLFVLAADRGDTDEVAFLLANGIDVNAGYNSSYSYAKYYQGEALIAASAFGHIDTVALLLANGAAMRVHISFNPFTEAVNGGHTNVVQLLLEYGAVPSSRDLHQACIKGHIEIAQLMLAHGARIFASFYSTDHNGNSTLLDVIKAGHIDVAELLITLAENKTIHDFFDDKVFCTAAANGYTNIVQRLLALGADIYADNDKALLLAGERGHTKTVKILAEHYLSIGDEAHLQSLLPTLPESAADLIKELLGS